MNGPSAGLLAPGTYESSAIISYGLFWQWLTAHLLGDFLLQRDATAGGRRRGDWRAYGSHGLLHLGLLAALTWPVASRSLVGAWVLVAGAHVLLDVCNEAAWRRLSGGSPGDDGGHATPAQVWLFLAHQALHVGLIGAVWRLVPPHALRVWLRGGTGPAFPDGYFSPLAWKTVAVGLAVVAAGAVLVRMTLQATRILPGEAGLVAEPAAAPGEEARSGATLGGVDGANSATVRSGTYIGMLERALVLGFLVMGAPEAVGLTVAAKSIARFRELEDRRFAEYYLVGTLLSVLVAVGGYLVWRHAP